MQSKLLTTSLLTAVLAVASPVLAENADRKSDTWLEAQLVTTYTLNRHLNVFDLDVEVEQGRVRLTGEVEEPVDRDLAEEIAKGIDGVRGVDNRIAVKSGVRDRERTADERTFSRQVVDATTTAAIKSKLLWNGNTHGLNIDVDTVAGRVTLHGTVHSEAEKELAGRIAGNTDDVVAVDNRLKVHPKKRHSSASASVEADVDTHGADASIGTRIEAAASDAGEAVSDGWVTTKVKSTLLFSRNVSGLDINVDTRDGVVTLKGDVDSHAQRQLVLNMVRDVRGVRKVENQLRVSGA